MAEQFLSTPSVRRATNFFFTAPCDAGISIHALREEGDLLFCLFRCQRSKISIHALREEGDDTASAISQQRRRFLSTPSVRRATLAAVSL